MTPEDFRRHGHALIDWIADYVEGVEHHPVGSAVAPGDILASLPEHPPTEAEPFEDVLADLDRIVMPGITHWQHPRFFAYFPSNSSYASILGDLASTGLGVQGMSWVTSPACTEVETRMVDWMQELLGLPDTFRSTSAHGGGVIQGSASEATLTSILAARWKATGGRVNHDGDTTRLVAYSTSQAHSSIEKGLRIAGIGTDHLRIVPHDEAFAMRPDELARMIADDRAAGLQPFWVCAALGTTSSMAFDPLPEIGRIARAEGLWLHVDAAMSGIATLVPELRWINEGMEFADSYCTNPHKWMGVSFDCDLFYTAHRDALLGALSILPEYLRSAAAEAGAVIDYRDWQIPLGRRFRALKLWFVIRHYGIEGLRVHIREHVRIAAVFEELVCADERFEVVTERTSALVCFRLRSRAGETAEQTDGRNADLLARINATGRVYLTHTVLPGFDGSDGGEVLPPRYVLRMAIGATRTEERHVRGAWEVVCAAAE